MLKTKLSKTGIWSKGLMLIIIPFGMESLAQPPVLYSWSELVMSLQSSKLQNSLLGYPNNSKVIAIDTLTAHEPVISLNPAAVTFVRTYLRKNIDDLERIKNYSQPYFKIIEDVFRKNNIPVELKYLAVIESELNSKAHSRVGARGPWQLMPTTARELGLHVSNKYDERILYYKSTVAAAKYLKSLYAELHDWLLVIAAYNSGTGTVENAIHRSGTVNFWKLQYFLPPETRLHVKRFIGTHYYFEEKGSLTTLTKAETTIYTKKLSDFMNKKYISAVNFDVNPYTGPDKELITTIKNIRTVIYMN